MKIRAFVSITVSLLLGIACATACGQPRANDAAARVATAAPTAEPTGVVRPARFAELATSVSQSIQQVQVQEGDWVKKGDLLAVLENSVPAAKLALAKANARTLASEQARSEIKLAEQELDRHFIRAPFEGQVTHVHLSAGNFAHTGTPVIALMNSKSLKTELNLPLEYWGKLKKGGQYKLLCSKPVSKILMGKVIYVSRVVDAKTNTFRVKFEIENFTQRLPVGFKVKLNSKVENNVVASK